MPETPANTRETPTATPAGSQPGRTLLVSVTVASLVAVVSGYLGAQWALRSWSTELAMRPPVLVVDIARAVRDAAPEQLEQLIARQRQIARQLANGGVLVLDAGAVIDAPHALFVRQGGAQ